MISTFIPAIRRLGRSQSGDIGGLDTTCTAFGVVSGHDMAESRLARAAHYTRQYGSLIVITTALMLGTMRVAHAEEFRAHELIISDPVTGAALLGFDPVSYQLERRARAGSDTHQVMHAGKVWHFSSAANRSAFVESPEGYLPVFGGHDPVAIAAGLPVAGDPRHHALREGRLYLFRTAENRARFLADDAIIAEAQRVWPEVKRGLQP